MTASQPAAPARDTAPSRALAGFILPLAFGVLNDLTGLWTSCFMALFALIAVSLAWMHAAVRRLERRAEMQPA